MYLQNKGMYYPLKQAVRDGVTNPAEWAYITLIKDMILEIKVIGAKKGKIYRLEYLGLGTTAWTTPLWEALISEYDAANYATSSATGQKDIIKLFQNNFGKPQSGVSTISMFSPDGEYTVVITMDYSEITTKNYTTQFITLNNQALQPDLWTLHIDESCYVYTAPRQNNYFKYNNADPTKPILEVFGKSGYDDYRFLFDKRTVNNLFALYNVHKHRGAFDGVQPFDPAVSYSQNATYAIASGKTDWIGPYVAKAVNNVDANPTLTFTGGAHSSLNNTDTGNPTARTVSIDILVDGNQMTTTSAGFFENLDIYVKQEIMSYNTLGTGRYTHAEITHYSIKGTKIDVNVSIQPYETIKIYTYYGLQSVISYYTSLYYKQAQSGNALATTADTNSGPKTTYFSDTVIAYRRNNTESCDEVLEMKMDNTIGLGQRKSVDDNLSNIFSPANGKVYMRLCGFYGNTKEMDMYPNYIYPWKGSWEFKSLPFPLYT